MGTPEIEDILRATLEDSRLSRGERKAFKGWLEEQAPDGQRLGYMRNRIFDIAAENLTSTHARQVLKWLEELTAVLRAYERTSLAPPTRAEGLFSPGPECLNRLRHLLSQTARTLDICVFTITDDRLSDAVRDAYRRGVTVRILSDIEKSGDLGSDLRRLEHDGIDVRFDAADKHMHHKFAIFDREVLVTGSYNWTRSAADSNEENLVVSDDPRLLRDFQGEFDRLWEHYSP